MVRDFADLFFIEYPSHHMISVYLCKWGSLEIRVDDHLVADDHFPRPFRLRYIYRVHLDRDHEYSLEVKAPVVKTHYYRFTSYIDGRKIRVRYHSYLIHRFEKEKTCKALLLDMLEYSFWPLFP